MNKNFSERTDILARHLRCSLRDLADLIRISQAMLFAYRSGKSEPTLKAWRKLEAAEIAAGLHNEPIDDSFSSVLREDPTPYRTPAKPEPLRTAGEPTMVERLETLQKLYGETRAELNEANRKLDALIDLIKGGESQ